MTDRISRREIAAARAEDTFAVALTEAERKALIDAALTDCPTGQRAGGPEGEGAAHLPASAPRLVGLVGLPRSGKDMAAEHLAGRYAGIRRLAFSDTIIAEANLFLAPFGAVIDEANKTHPPYRLLLQTFGVVRRRERETYWVERVEEAVRAAWQEGARMVIATGVRAPSDVELIRRLDGRLWRVRRPGHESLADLHPIERMLADWPDAAFDRVLLNAVEGDTAAYMAGVEAALAGGSV